MQGDAYPIGSGVRQLEGNGTIEVIATDGLARMVRVVSATRSVSAQATAGDLVASTVVRAPTIVWGLPVFYEPQAKSNTEMVRVCIDVRRQQLLTPLRH